jgi:spore coat protein U-like protein
MNMSRLIFASLVILLLAWSASASAQTCTVASSSGLNFGSNLSATPTGQIDVNGTIVLTCIGGGNAQPRRACLSLGTDAPVPNPRRLVSGANTLNFQVYDTSSGGAVIATSASESTGTIMERAFTSGTPSGTPVNVSFGTVTRLTSPINAATNATVTCTSGAPWTLAMNAGSTPGNTYAARRMSLGGSGPGAVQYQIYRDSGPVNVWGNGTSGTVTRSGTGVGIPQSIPIYLQVPAQTPQAEGTYSDTVTATLTL